MNLDANVQKIISLILVRWKLIVVFAIIGAMLSCFYTANFTTLTYSSSVEFLTYSDDTRQEFGDSTSVAQTVSNTSKMNYAIKMLDTYIELFKTNEFNQKVADDINKKYSTSYTASQVRNAVTVQGVENTAMFKVTVNTADADMSYRIAKQIETSIPEKMAVTNSGLVKASVEDPAVKATTSDSLQYFKKGTIGFIIGAIIAVVYIILRDLLDVHIKGTDGLAERYGIPVLGSIPEFEFVPASAIAKDTKEKGE